MYTDRWEFVSHKYYPTIDGLRAIAVLSVVIFHFFPKLLTGGYVGVDVFFVISGYLVTGIIKKEIESHKFSILNFYKKRINRLFPSLLLVCLVVFVFALVFLLAAELKILSYHLFSSLSFFSNILYFFEAGYFDKSSELKPLLHMWSLNLEEQFYFFWPWVLLVLVKFCSKNKSTMIKLLYVICSISFLLCVYYTYKNQSMAFFNLPFRIWELGLGGILAILHANGSQFLNKHYEKRKIVSAIGLFLILLSVFVFSSRTKFPGFTALIPVLATLMLLCYRDDESGVKAFLKTPFMTYIGKVSYPFYLWHWPVFSFSYILFGGYVDWYCRVLLLLLSLVLSVLTYEFVEKRVNRQFTALSVFLLVFNFIIIFASLLVYKFNGLPQRYPSYEALASSKSHFLLGKKDQRNSNFCKNNFEDVEVCLLSDEGRSPTVVLLGDSHANHLYVGVLSKLQKNENLLLLAKSGTAPLYGVKSKRAPADTDLDKEIDYILNTKEIHTVVLSAYWSNYYEEKGVFVAGEFYKNKIYSEELNSENQSEVFSHHLIEMLKQLIKAKKKVIFVYDVPSFDFDLESCIERPLVKSAFSCKYTPALEIEKQKGYRNMVKPELEKYSIRSIDPLEKLCSKLECKIINDGKYLYADSHHLSNWGSETALKDFNFEKAE